MYGAASSTPAAFCGTCCATARRRPSSAASATWVASIDFAFGSAIARLLLLRNVGGDRQIKPALALLVGGGIAVLVEEEYRLGGVRLRRFRVDLGLDRDARLDEPGLRERGNGQIDGDLPGFTEGAHRVRHVMDRQSELVHEVFVVEDPECFKSGTDRHAYLVWLTTVRLLFLLRGCANKRVRVLRLVLDDLPEVAPLTLRRHEIVVHLLRHVGVAVDRPFRGSLAGVELDVQGFGGGLVSDGRNLR